MEITFPDPLPDQTSWRLYFDCPDNKIIEGETWRAETRPPVFIAEFPVKEGGEHMT